MRCGFLGVTFVHPTRTWKVRLFWINLVIPCNKFQNCHTLPYPHLQLFYQNWFVSGVLTFIIKVRCRLNLPYSVVGCFQLFRCHFHGSLLYSFYCISGLFHSRGTQLVWSVYQFSPVHGSLICLTLSWDITALSPATPGGRNKTGRLHLILISSLSYSDTLFNGVILLLAISLLSAFYLSMVNRKTIVKLMKCASFCDLFEVLFSFVRMVPPLLPNLIMFDVTVVNDWSYCLELE